MCFSMSVFCLQLQDKATILTTERKKVLYYSFTCYIVYICCDTVLYNVTLLELLNFVPSERKNCARGAG